MSTQNDKLSSWALLLTRFAFGTRLIVGSADNVFSWERMLEFESFLRLNGFPMSLTSAIVSVYLQFLAGISWLVGFKTRVSALIMTANFIVAIVGVHLFHGDSYLNTAPAIHLLAVSVLLWAIGPGKYSFDYRMG